MALVKGKCGKCRKESSFQADVGQPTTVWVCPKPKKDGSLCGHTNEVATKDSDK